MTSPFAPYKSGADIRLSLPEASIRTHPIKVKTIFFPSAICQPAKTALLLCAMVSGTLVEARADTASVATAATTLVNSSVAAGTSTTVRTDYSLTTDKQWTNLPGGTRNGPTIGGGSKALTTDLSTTVPSGQTVSPRAAAVSLAQTALSTAGYNTMEEIRHADDVIRSTDNTQSWNYSNYHIATLVPSSVTSANLSTYLASSPWMLQISGHHLTYNITYNAPYVSATPMFIGTEPPDYYSIGTDFTTTEKAVVKGRISGTLSYLVSSPYNSTSSTTTTTTDPGVSSGTLRAPLETQRAAVSALATSLQADNTGAKLSGTFSDVVMGVTNSGDGNFPFIGTTPTYPTGTTGRGILYTSLTTTEKAQVKAVIEAWVNTQAGDISTSLLADYESDAALAQTYVGYQVGAGSADGGTTRCNFDALVNQETTPINSQNSYLRVDGPRVWVEMVVQAAVAYRNQNFVHYHSLWRDKLADYGNEFGGFLDTTSTSTTYTRPTITTQPTSVTGGSATFTVAATANTAGAAATLSYQWYNASGAISTATGASYTTSTAGSYYVKVSSAYGTVTSNTVTLTANTSATAPTITTQPTSQTVNSGNSATFSVTATGNGTLTYQWYSGAVGSGTAISSATASTYTTSTAGSYYVIVTNTLNGTNASTTSSLVTLTVTTATAPTITTQPVSQTVASGNTATFTVAASGNGTLSYQWYNASGAINGATSASYTTGTAGTYYVVVTNMVGTSMASTTSSTATLTINSAPTITTQPSNQTVVLGNSATFSVAATGSGTLSYQWYIGSVGNGTAIAGATGATYTIATTTSSSAGTYYVAVTNSVGTTNSAAATLTLTEPFAAYLSAYGLTGTAPATDSDGDGISNLVEFVLGGNPTVSDTSILPMVSYTTSGGTTYLVYSFYTVANLGSATWTVEYSTDLSNWASAANGTNGVTITTTAYNASYNATTVTIPDTASGGKVFARFRATLPSGYTGAVTNSTAGPSSLPKGPAKVYSNR